MILYHIRIVNSPIYFVLNSHKPIQTLNSLRSSRAFNSPQNLFYSLQRLRPFNPVLNISISFALLSPSSQLYHTHLQKSSTNCKHPNPLSPKSVPKLSKNQYFSSKFPTLPPYSYLTVSNSTLLPRKSTKKEPVFQPTL